MEIQKTLEQLGAVDLLALSRQLNEVIAQLEDAKNTAWRVRMPKTAYAVGDTVIMPGAGNFYRVMQCSSVPDGKSTGLTGAAVLDYSTIADGNTEIVDGEITWRISSLVTVPDMPDAPVSSMNGKTGDVVVSCASIGAIPRTGGLLTGPLCSTQRYPFLLADTSDTTLQCLSFVAARASNIADDQEHQHNAKLDLFHKDASNYGEVYNGAFNLQAATDGKKSVLFGKPDGSLTWQDRNIVRAVNGVYADVAGNVSLQGGYGEIIAFAGNERPAGRYLICNGAAISRTTYKELFAAIGTTYGAGDGSTTFNLPNLSGKFLEGSATAGTEKAAGLPNITGNFTGVYYEKGNTQYPDLATHYSGAMNITGNYFNGIDTANANLRVGYGSLDASKSSAVYGKSDTVQPPAVTVRYFIKY